jgi:hypothetical protein
VPRAAHHDDVGLELRSQFALFRERREIVFGRNPARRTGTGV